MSEEFEKNMRAAFSEWLQAGDSSLSFDLYAQDPQEWAFLRELVPGLVVASAGGMCPFQAEGLLGEWNFYYRERGGYASLSLAPTQDECYGPNPHYSAGEEVEEFREGAYWLDTLINLVPKLKRVDYCYLFPYGGLEWPDPQEPLQVRPAKERRPHDLLSSRGATSQEALEKLKTFKLDPWLSSRGWSEEEQRAVFECKLLTLQEEPLEEDSRVFPTPPPTFEVTVPEAWRGKERIWTPWAPEDTPKVDKS